MERGVIGTPRRQATARLVAAPGSACHHSRVSPWNLPCPSPPPAAPTCIRAAELDRAANLRDEKDWLASALRGARANWIPLWRGRHLIQSDSKAVLLRQPATNSLLDGAWPWAFLGILDGDPVFAVDFGHSEDFPAEFGAVQFDGSWVELRSVAVTLPADEAALLAHARGLLHWRANHRFCGHCGASLQPVSGGNTLQCEKCERQHFPRTDPAVIMLIAHEDRALLAHSARFPNPIMFSTLAGFVEPGESLEEAVAREVLEEVGIRVRDVVYHSSQPWPFPGSLMIGFYAQAADTRLVIDGHELDDARWFSRNQIREAERHGFAVPGPDSIARRLIDDWMDLD